MAKKSVKTVPAVSAETATERAERLATRPGLVPGAAFTGMEWVSPTPKRVKGAQAPPKKSGLATMMEEAIRGASAAAFARQAHEAAELRRIAREQARVAEDLAAAQAARERQEALLRQAAALERKAAVSQAHADEVRGACEALVSAARWAAGQIRSNGAADPAQTRAAAERLRDLRDTRLASWVVSGEISETRAIALAEGINAGLGQAREIIARAKGARAAAVAAAKAAAAATPKAAERELAATRQATATAWREAVVLRRRAERLLRSAQTRQF